MKSVFLFLFLLGWVGILKAQSPALFEMHYSSLDTGKAPAHWIYNGRCKVTTLKGIPGYWLKLQKLGSYLPELSQTLPTSFRLSFDFIYHSSAYGNNITEVTLFSCTDQDELDVLSPGQDGVRVNFENFVISYLCYSTRNFVDTISAELRTDMIKNEQVTPIRIDVDSMQLKVWVHNQLLFTRPYCFASRPNRVRFQLRGSLAEPWIGNLKIENLK